MKRFVSLLLSAVLLLGLFAGCRKEPAVETQTPDQWPGAAELAEAVFSRSGFDGDTNGLERLSADKDEAVFLSDYLANAYGLEDPWRDAAVIRGTGMSAFEVAVVRMEDEEAAVRAATALMNYTFERQGDFAGYAPDQADMAANGEVLQRGPYAVLFICPDPKGAGAAVGKLLDGEIVLPPELEPSAQPAVDVKALRDLVVSSQEMPGAKLKLLDDGDSDKLNAYVTDAYGLAPERWEEGAIARDEATAFEVAVMRVPGEGTVVWEIKDYLTDYLNRREAQFNPVSIQARLLHEAIVGEAADGTQYYVLLLACKPSGRRPRKNRRRPALKRWAPWGSAFRSSTVIRRPTPTIRTAACLPRPIGSICPCTIRRRSALRGSWATPPGCPNTTGRSTTGRKRCWARCWRTA